ncbi:MAG: hypothetical protein ACI4RM_01255 [Ruminococcus sp.]
MDKKKSKKAFLLPEKSIKKIESIYVLKGNVSRNQIVEQAIDFYHSYLTAELSQDYLCSTVGQKVEGSINQSADRIGRLLFKMAVETNILARVQASTQGIDRTTYDKLRKAAVDDAKATKGIISLYDA